jgi:hypothetical protein
MIIEASRLPYVLHTFSRMRMWNETRVKKIVRNISLERLRHSWENNLKGLYINRSRDSVDSTVIRKLTGRFRVRIPRGERHRSLLWKAQTDSGAHTVSYSPICFVELSLISMSRQFTVGCRQRPCDLNPAIFSLGPDMLQVSTGAPPHANMQIIHHYWQACVRTGYGPTDIGIVIRFSRWIYTCNF